MKFIAGKIFPYPHGSMAIDGRQKWMLSSRRNEKYSNVPILVIENDHALGVIKLKNNRPVDFQDLLKRESFEKHQHTKDELLNWFETLDKVWVEDIEVVERFKRPIPVKIPSEAVVWVNADNIEFVEVFEKMDLLTLWREAWSTGNWKTEFMWEVLAEDDFESVGANVDEIPDAFLYVLMTQGNPDLTDKQKGERGRAIQTILSNTDWSGEETDTLKVAFEILSLMEDEEYRNMALNRVAKELRDRGVKVEPKFEKIIFSYLPVRSMSEEKGDLREVISIFNKNAILYKNAVMVVGSAVSEGFGGDLDILIRQEVPKELAERIAFRLGRACLDRKDTKFHIFRGDGPFGPHIPLYDIALIAVPHERIDMEKQLDIYTSPFQLVPLEPMKPIRVGIRSTIEASIETIKNLGLVGYIQPKADGIHCFIVVDGDKKAAYSEDGRDITDAIPKIIDKLPDGSYILDGEIETWIDGKHQPREQTSGNVTAKRSENLTFVAFDCLFYNGVDLRHHPFKSRLAALNKVCKDWPVVESNPPVVGRLKTYKVEREDELREYIDQILAIESAEGFVWKSGDGLYIPKGNVGYQVKWRRNAVLSGVVLDRKETKVSGVYNYVWGIEADDLPAKRPVYINGTKYMVIGKTFSSKRTYNQLDPVNVEVETINIILEDDKIDVTAWAPKIIEEAQ